MRWGKSTYMPKSASFYNLLHVQGEGHVFVKAEQILRVSNLFGKKGCSRCSMGEKKSSLESKIVRWWRGRKHLFKSARISVSLTAKA